MQETRIAWTDMTWNPMSGCRRISPGCRHCYAETFAERKRGTPAFPIGFDPMTRPHKLREPMREKSGKLIFVNSMSDFFLEDFDDEFRDRVVATINATPHHRYQILTKREDTMVRYWSTRRVPRNVWAGVTIESNTFIRRADALRRVDASVRFLSLEPLLSPMPDLELDGIHWVIVGGESGTHLANNEKVRDRRALVRREGRRWVPREDRREWIEDIAQRCREAGVAFFFKQWGGIRPDSCGCGLGDAEPKAFPSFAGAMPDRSATMSLPIVGGA